METTSRFQKISTVVIAVGIIAVLVYLVFFLSGRSSADVRPPKRLGTAIIQGLVYPSENKNLVYSLNVNATYTFNITSSGSTITATGKAYIATQTTPTGPAVLAYSGTVNRLSIESVNRFTVYATDANGANGTFIGERVIINPPTGSMAPSRVVNKAGFSVTKKDGTRGINTGLDSLGNILTLLLSGRVALNYPTY